jgi:CO/xanthine dehydrogenase Mo-binding subunit
MSARLAGPTRRGLLAGGGALILSFRLGPTLALDEQGGTPPPQKPALPGSLKEQPWLDAWIRIDADGAITVKTGKAELGQGIKTAIVQVAAEELRVDPHALKLVTADTSETANEGYTAGSHSMQDSATAIRNAAAQMREILIALAAERLGLPADSLKAEGGLIIAGDGRRLGFGELVSADVLHVQAQPTSKLTETAAHKVIGTSLPRVDIPGKVTGGPAYVQDMRPPGMVHARVVRPPSYGATLQDVDTSAIERMPGVIKVMRDGNFLAVVAEREWPAITAMAALGANARWQVGTPLPEAGRIFETLASLPADEHVILDKQAATGTAVKTVKAAYHRHYQLHGSIGPSCALALFEKDQLTVWSHAQGMFPLRGSIAEMLRLKPEQVRCIHVEGSGCYGHNAADDAAADAALIARAVPGRSVRLQLMREQEHMTEPYGPAMTTQAEASLDAMGRIVDWNYEVRSNTHSTRPPGAGNLLAARLLAQPFEPPAPKPLPLPEGGGDRNAIPLYALPNARVVHHFVPEMPLRVSAMRGLGAYVNVFSIESFMDELAAAGGVDPVAFRLNHLEDARARDVIELAAERYGWQGRQRHPGRGHGFAFARYKNLGAYAAVAAEVEVQPETGRVRLVRAVVGVDSGEAVNPDGIRNQIQGGVLQSTSWTLYEEVTFDRRRITSRDWSTYPILRMNAVPESVDVHIMGRPGQPFLGTGEATQGPTAGAIANAVADATGVRLREIPFSPERVRAALLG